MNTKELVEKIASINGLSKTNAKGVVDTFLETVSQSLAEGEEVRLGGFGIFSVRHRPQRQGRNPQTGETITIAASKSINFKATKALKDAL